MPEHYVLAHWMYLELVDARDLCVSILDVA